MSTPFLSAVEAALTQCIHSASSEEASTRTAAYEAFLKAGLPTRRTPGFRKLDFKTLQESSFVIDNTHTPFMEWPEGISCEPIALENTFDEASCFLNLNRALRTQTWHINIPASTQLEAPLKLLHTLSEGTMAHVAYHITVGAGSTLSFVDTHESTGQTFSTSSIHLEISPHATVHWLSSHTKTPQAHHVSFVHAGLAEHSRFEHIDLSLDTGFKRQETSVYLQGFKAHACLHGLLGATQKQQLSAHTTLHHQAADTHSEEHYYALGAESARTDFRGRIHIAPNAQKVTANQQSKNLLLSENASMGSQPELEIYANDVQCRHGSTTASLEEGARFYLASRGIPEEKAQQLLIEGFLQTPIQSLPASLKPFVSDTLIPFLDTLKTLN